MQARMVMRSLVNHGHIKAIEDLTCDMREYASQVTGCIPQLIKNGKSHEDTIEALRALKYASGMIRDISRVQEYLLEAENDYPVKCEL